MSDDFDKELRVGVVQTTVDSLAAWSGQLQMSQSEEERVVAEIQRHLTSLSLEQPRPDIVLLPELSIPLGFLDRLRKISARLNAIIIGGMDFEIDTQDKAKVVNRAAVIIPDGWQKRDRSSRATLRYVGKTYPAWREQERLKKLNYDFKPIPEVWVFDGGRLGRFAVAVCFDFLDLERVAMYRLEVQHLFILSYNLDITSFNHAAEALARMIYCNIVICNTGTYGGSLAVSPYKVEVKRVIYRHSGNGLSTSQTICLPVRTLIEAQSNKPIPRDNRLFKSLPPGAKDQVKLHKFSESL